MLLHENTNFNSAFLTFPSLLSKNNKLVSEKKLVSFWLNSKMQEIFAKKELYMKYCPVCKSKNTENNQNIYKCCDCGSIYTFKDGDRIDTIWFLKLRR